MGETTGTFELPKWDEQTYAEIDGERYVRVSTGKVFDGGIVVTGEGELLQVFVPSGTAAYVGIERVAATVDGRAGTFVLQHTAVGSAAGGSMSVTVVAGSGTADLAGLTGTLDITRAASGEHGYTFMYSVG